MNSHAGKQKNHFSKKNLNKRNKLIFYLIIFFTMFKYFRMACWYPKIKSAEIFNNEYMILFVVPSSITPQVNNNNNRSLLFNFWTAHRYLKMLVHKNYKFKLLLTQKFPYIRVTWYLSWRLLKPGTEWNGTGRNAP